MHRIIYVYPLDAIGMPMYLMLTIYYKGVISVRGHVVSDPEIRMHVFVVLVFGCITLIRAN